jgi:hypothetical protein
MSKGFEEPAESAVSEPSAEDVDELKEAEKQKLAAAEEDYAAREAASNEGYAPGEPGRQQDRGCSGGTAWVPGVILIGLGVVFLFSNLTGFELHNWWALFILIPAFASFGKALEAMRREGEMTREVWGALSGGAILLLIAGAFLFNLNWGLIWPIFLIIGGLGMLLGARGAW